MQCYTELTPPTAVTHAVSLPFVTPNANNLVVAKSSLLQVFEVQTLTAQHETALTSPTLEKVDSSEFSHQRIEPTSKLVLVAEYNLSGTVTDISRIKALDTKSGGEALLIAFRDAKLSLVEWDPEQHNLTTVSIHYYEGEELHGCPWEPNLGDFHNFLASDPSSRCAALKFGARKLAILPFRQAGDDLVEEDYDPDFDAHMEEPKKSGIEQVDSAERKTPYKASFVLPLTAIDPALTHPVHLAFLYEYREPTFGLISSTQAPSDGLLLERKDILTYSVFTLDLDQRASTMLLTVQGLPYDIWRVMPLPLPVGGALLIGVNELIHVDQAGKTYAIGVNEFARKASAYSMHDQSDLAMRLEGCVIEELSSETGELLIILHDGEIAVLRFEMDGRSVSGVSIKKISEENGGHIGPNNPSCITSVGKNRIFAGSEDSDSALLGWTGRTPQISRKRSRAQLLVEDDDLSFDEDDLDDDFEDDLYADEGATTKKTAVAQVESTDFSQVIFKVHDVLANYGPMNSIALGNSAATSLNVKGIEIPENIELVASVGQGKAGALAVLKREIEPTALRQTVLPNHRSLWTISARKETPDRTIASEQSPLEDLYDQYLIVAKVEGTDGEPTTVFSVNGLDLEENSDGDLERDGFTIDMGTLCNGTKIVQVLRNEIRMVDSELGLAQILPMEDEETGAELQVTSVSFADPHLLALRDDSSAVVYTINTDGELEETGRNADQKSKWRSGCLYTSAATQNKTLAFLLNTEGSLQIFELPNLSDPVFTTEGLKTLPHVLTANYVAPRRAIPKAGLIEILVADIGDALTKSPYLIVRTASDSIDIYKPFHHPAAGEEQSFTTNLKWRKVSQPNLPKSNDDPYAETREDPRLRALTIGSYSAVAKLSNSSALIVKEASTSPRLVHFRGEALDALASFNSPGCDKGMAMLDEDGTMRLAKLATDFRYAELGWASRKIPLHEDVGPVCFHPQKQVYVTAINRKIDFSLPEDAHHHYWAQESIELRPQMEQGVLKMLHPGNWSIIDTVELEENEVALCVKVLNLEVSETTHERKHLVVVGTAILRGEDLATRGHCYVYDVISVVPEPGRPETNRKLRLIVKEEVKGAVTAVSEIGSQGFLLMAQGQKCMVRGLKEDGTLLPVAFMDMQTVVTVLKTLPGTGMVLMGDAAKGIWFTGYTEEPYKMIPFGKGRPQLDVMATDFLPHEKNLYIVVADADSNIHVLQFDPEHPKSLSGARLLHKSSFHAGHFPTSLTLLPSTARRSTVAEAAATNEMLEAPSSTEEYDLLLTTQSGALALITPLAEPEYRRLGALQTFLTSVLDHPCGLNPKAYRSVDNEAFAGRGVLDGTILRRWKELTWSKQVEGLGKVGVESGNEWVLEADLGQIAGAGLTYL